MDKSTLSNYGWIIIVTLILAVMLALATPFGTYVGDGVVAVANSFVKSADNVMDEDNIDQMKSEWTGKLDYSALTNNGNALEHKGKIPAGGTYITGLKFSNSQTIYTCCGNDTDYHFWCWCDATIYREGDNFPTTVKQYDIYIYGDYVYMYQAINAYLLGYGCPYKIIVDGVGTITGFYNYTNSTEESEQWCVGLNTSINNILEKTTYGEILSSINNKNVTSVRDLFSNANGNSSVRITTAPKIPQTVTDATGTFNFLTTITGTIELPCHININSYSGCNATVSKYHYDGCGH